MRLSAAQRRVLELLSGGDELMFTPAPERHHFWRSARLTVYPQTTHALWKLGLITEIKEQARGRYELTDKGRALAEKLRGEGS